MGERIGNLSRRESMSIGSGDGMGTRRQYRTGLFKWYLGIFTGILLGLATILITPADPTLASITSTSRTPSARIAPHGHTLFRQLGFRVAWNFKGPRLTQRT